MEQIDGLWTNQYSMTAYNGSTSYSVARNQRTYLGSFYVPSASTTLGAAISSTSATSATLAAAVWGQPTNTYYIEVIAKSWALPAGFNDTSIDITRGQLGTTAAIHSDGTP